MAADEQTPNTAPIVASETITEPVDETVVKPVEAHEKPSSLSSHDSGDVDLEKQPQDSGMASAEQVQSNAESIYPGGAAVAAVMASLILAIFLIALVNTKFQFQFQLRNG